MFIKTSAHPAYAESPQHQLEQYHTDPGECIHSFTEDLPQEKWKSQNHSDIGNPESALTQYCVNRIYQKLSNTHTDTHTHTHTHKNTDIDQSIRCEVLIHGRDWKGNQLFHDRYISSNGI